MVYNNFHRVLGAVAMLAFASPAPAQDNVLNLYSSRHYETDEALYSNFTKLTGIKVNRIEANENALLERVRNEGARSPADVLLTVDAGRLWTAEQMGLLQPVKSPPLEEPHSRQPARAERTVVRIFAARARDRLRPQPRQAGRGPDL